MNSVKQYLLSVLAASIICGIVNRFSGKQAFTSAIVRLVSSLFVALCVFSPLLKVKFSDLSENISLLEAAASAIIQEAQQDANEETAAIIKERTEAYILSKAASYEISITVRVELDDSENSLPSKVTIQGEASPYVRKCLQNDIAVDLGIPKEKQIWT